MILNVMNGVDIDDEKTRDIAPWFEVPRTFEPIDYGTNKRLYLIILATSARPGE